MEGVKNAASQAVRSVASVNPKLAGCIAVGTVAVVAAPVVIPAAAAAIGFTSGGIAAGSTAASMMSAAWTSGQGVWVISGLQSIGAAGIGTKGMAVAGAAGYKLTSVILRK